VSAAGRSSDHTGSGARVRQQPDAALTRAGAGAALREPIIVRSARKAEQQRLRCLGAASATVVQRLLYDARGTACVVGHVSLEMEHSNAVE